MCLLHHSTGPHSHLLKLLSVNNAVDRTEVIQFGFCFSLIITVQPLSQIKERVDLPHIQDRSGLENQISNTDPSLVWNFLQKLHWCCPRLFPLAPADIGPAQPPLPRSQAGRWVLLTHVTERKHPDSFSCVSLGDGMPKPSKVKRKRLILGHARGFCSKRGPACKDIQVIGRSQDLGQLLSWRGRGWMQQLII